MADFDLAVRYVLEDEGVLTNNLRTDPDGGLTNFGISQKQNPDVDVAHLTRDRAIIIYHNRYWVTMHCDVMRWPLNFLVFDTAVNQGPRSAADLLQQAVGVTVDGIVGTVTLAAAARRFLDRGPQVVSFADRLLLFIFEGAADDQPHAAVVPDQSIDAA